MIKILLFQGQQKIHANKNLRKKHFPNRLRGFGKIR